MDPIALKRLVWVGSSKRDFVAFPDDVKSDMGFALFEAQQGKEHQSAKALKGYGGRGVLELVGRHDGDAYRAVYTVRFPSAVYVLHAFQKKSTRGRVTPAREMVLVNARLRDAETLHSRTAEEGPDG